MLKFGATSFGLSKRNIEALKRKSKRKESRDWIILTNQLNYLIPM
jgi:hypothetical protein